MVNNPDPNKVIKVKIVFAEDEELTIWNPTKEDLDLFEIPQQDDEIAKAKKEYEWATLKMTPFLLFIYCPSKYSETVASKEFVLPEGSLVRVNSHFAYLKKDFGITLKDRHSTFEYRAQIRKDVEIRFLLVRVHEDHLHSAKKLETIMETRILQLQEEREKREESKKQNH